MSSQLTRGRTRPRCTVCCARSPASASSLKTATAGSSSVRWQCRSAATSQVRYGRPPERLPLAPRALGGALAASCRRASRHSSTSTAHSAIRLPHPAPRSDMTLFAEAMTSMSGTECTAKVALYDFSTATTIVELSAAGREKLLAAILRSSPTPRGVLFDLPGAIASAHAVMGAASVTDRFSISSSRLLRRRTRRRRPVFFRSSTNWGMPRGEHSLQLPPKRGPSRHPPAHRTRNPSPTSRPRASGWTSPSSLCRAGMNAPTRSTRTLLEAAGFVIPSIIPTAAHLRFSSRASPAADRSGRTASGTRSRRR